MEDEKRLNLLNKNRVIQELKNSEIKNIEKTGRKKAADYELLYEPLLEKGKLRIFIYDEVGSTNDRAKQFVQESGEKEKRLKSLKKDFNLENTDLKISREQALQNSALYVFAADRQISGRGRRGKSWLSDDQKSLSVSFLFPAEAEIEKIPQITAAAALAVRDSLLNFNLDTVIKWPNDILAGGKKLAGILSELTFTKEKQAYVVIGCGINLNNLDFADQIKDIATSYYLETGKKIDKNFFLAELIKNIHYYKTIYLNKGREEVIAEWKKELNLEGKKLEVVHEGENKKIFVKDILDNGEILAEFEDGTVKKLASFNTSIKYSSLNQ